jgi:hypothetical protein
MATAPVTSATKTPTKNDKDKAEKPKKEPKPLLTRLDEQITRAVIAKKVTVDDMTKFEARVSKLKALLEE